MTYKENYLFFYFYRKVITLGKVMKKLGRVTLSEKVLKAFADVL